MFTLDNGKKNILTLTKIYLESVISGCTIRHIIECSCFVSGAKRVMTFSCFHIFWSIPKFIFSHLFINAFYLWHTGLGTLGMVRGGGGGGKKTSTSLSRMIFKQIGYCVETQKFVVTCGYNLMLFYCIETQKCYKKLLQL